MIFVLCKGRKHCGKGQDGGYKHLLLLCYTYSFGACTFSYILFAISTNFMHRIGMVFTANTQGSPSRYHMYIRNIFFPQMHSKTYQILVTGICLLYFPALPRFKIVFKKDLLPFTAISFNCLLKKLRMCKIQRFLRGHIQLTPTLPKINLFIFFQSHLFRRLQKLSIWTSEKCCRLVKC